MAAYEQKAQESSPQGWRLLLLFLPLFLHSLDVCFLRMIFSLMVSGLQVLMCLKGPKWKKHSRCLPHKRVKTFLLHGIITLSCKVISLQEEEHLLHFSGGLQTHIKWLWTCRPLHSVLERKKCLFGVNYIEEWSRADLAYWGVGSAGCGLPFSEPSVFVSVSPKAPVLLALTVTGKKRTTEEPKKNAQCTCEQPRGYYCLSWGIMIPI